MKEKFDRNKPHMDIRDIKIIKKIKDNGDIKIIKKNNNDSLEKTFEYQLSLYEKYIEECVRNNVKPRIATFKDYKNINFSQEERLEVSPVAIMEFKQAIINNDKMNMEYYGKKIIESLAKEGYSKEEIWEKLNSLIPTNKDIQISYPIDEENNKSK